MGLKETDEGTWKQTSVSNGPIWYHMAHFQLFWDSEGSLRSKSDIQLSGLLGHMIGYEFYWRDPIRGYQLIGVQLERRKNPGRITQESVINLAKKLIGDNVNVNDIVDLDDIFFIRITKDENTGEILRPDSVYRPLKEYFKDRRKYPRVHMDLPLEYRVKYDARAHGGIVIDASEGGFLIYSTEDIPIGTELKIAVLFSAEYELAKFEVFAEIIWNRVDVGKAEEGYQYGLKFIQILEEDYWKLRKLLSGRFK